MTTGEGWRFYDAAGEYLVLPRRVALTTSPPKSFERYPLPPLRLWMELSVLQATMVVEMHEVALGRPLRTPSDRSDYELLLDELALRFSSGELVAYRKPWEPTPLAGLKS